jgi:hypothetical protein
MVGENDQKDKKDSRALAIALLALVLVLAGAVIMMMPVLSEIVDVHLSPGLGLKDSAIVAFFVTIVVLIVFAIAAGDGLIGELQFMIPGFFSFFLILWLMIAWIF